MSSEKHLANEIRTELRGIIRQRDDLQQPLASFTRRENAPEGRPPYYVNFDSRPHRDVIGLQIGVKQLKLPDERILDMAYRLAESVWHLKDRLKAISATRGIAHEIEDVVARSKELLIVADLANNKKHGPLRRPRSSLTPCFGVLSFDKDGNPIDGRGFVRFDTSASGTIELYYDGARMDKELLVTHREPIPFTLQVLVGDPQTSLGNAADLVYLAFRDLLPLIGATGVLEGDSPQIRVLASDLGIANHVD